MLSSPHRLRLQRDFDWVYKRGRLVSGPLFNLKFVRGKDEPTKFGFVISKKTEPKVNKRNLVKRRARAVVAKLNPHIFRGWSVVIFIKRPAVGADHAKIALSLKELFVRAKLMNREKNG